jgi:hypothetical protein
VVDINANIKRFPWVTPSGTSVIPVGNGVTADELKVQQGKGPALPDVAPIAQRGPVEFISPTTSSDQLRLATPISANPYATPTGPRHDHMMIREAIDRSHSDVSKSLMTALKKPPAGVSEKAAGQMRASLSREHAMLALLQTQQKMQEEIYGRIIGSQEG